MSEFGERIKELRKNNQVTQRDLAQKIGMNFSYISKIENDALGDNMPSEATINKIAGALDANPEELILLAKKVPKTMRETIVDDDLAVEFLRKVPALSDKQRKEWWERLKEDSSE